MFKTIFDVIDENRLTEGFTETEKEDLTHEIFMEVINKKITDSEKKLTIGKPRHRQRKR